MAKERLRKKKKWIQSAIKHPGALRATAKEMGLIHDDEPLSESDLRALEAKGGVTARRARLARTLKRMH
jgi:hypothetical protein